MNKILETVGQVVTLLLGIGFFFTSVVFMSIVYQVIPNYSVAGKPVSIIVGPIVNTQVGAILFIIGLVWLGVFMVIRHKAKHR